MKSSLPLLTGLIILSQSILSVSAAVPTSPPTGWTPGGVFSLYFQNMVGSVPCPAGSIIKTYDTTPGTNYGKRQCVSLAAWAVKDAFSGFDPTTWAPVYMNAWLKSGTSVYYNTAGWNVGIWTSTPTAKLEVNGNIKASGNISTPASTVLTSWKIQVLDIVTENAACTPNGLIARDSVWVLLSCQSGTWKKASGGGIKQVVSNAKANYSNSATVTRPGVASVFSCSQPSMRYSIDASGNVYVYAGGGGAQFVCTISNSLGWCVSSPMGFGAHVVSWLRVSVTSNGLMAPYITTSLGMVCTYSLSEQILYPWIY